MSHSFNANFVSKAASNLNIDMVEVVVRCEMKGHVGENHGVFEQGEDGVHAGLAVGVVAPVAVQRGKDAREVYNQ